MQNWIVTDPSCNQQMRQLNESTFEFKEDRTVDPLTGKVEEYSQIINVDNYSLPEIIEYTSSYGYSISDVSLWLTNGNKALIAECIFEMTTD